MKIKHVNLKFCFLSFFISSFVLWNISSVILALDSKPADKAMSTDLFVQQAEKGDLEAVTSAINTGINLDSMDRRGNT